MLIRLLYFLAVLQGCSAPEQDSSIMVLQAIAADRDYLEVGGRW